MIGVGFITILMAAEFVHPSADVTVYVIFSVPVGSAYGSNLSSPESPILPVYTPPDGEPFNVTMLPLVHIGPGLENDKTGIG